MTNVKPQDLAIAVGEDMAENRNKIVKVLARSSVESLLNAAVGFDAAVWWDCETLQPFYVAPNGRWGEKSLKPAGHIVSIPDANLRPLRDNDGADETFAWAGKPEPVRDPVHSLISEAAGA